MRNNFLHATTVLLPKTIISVVFLYEFKACPACSLTSSLRTETGPEEATHYLKSALFVTIVAMVNFFNLWHHFRLTLSAPQASVIGILYGEVMNEALLGVNFDKRHGLETATREPRTSDERQTTPVK